MKIFEDLEQKDSHQQEQLDLLDTELEAILLEIEMANEELEKCHEKEGQIVKTILEEIEEKQEVLD